MGFLMTDHVKKAQFESAVKNICGNNAELRNAVMAGYDAIYEGAFTKLAATAAIVLGLGLGSQAAAGEVVAKNCHGNSCQIYDDGSLVGYTDASGNLYDASSNEMIERGVVKDGKINAPKEEVKCGKNGCSVYDAGQKVGTIGFDTDLDFDTDDDEEMRF